MGREMSFFILKSFCKKLCNADLESDIMRNFPLWNFSSMKRIAKRTANCSVCRVVYRDGRGRCMCAVIAGLYIATLALWGFLEPSVKTWQWSGNWLVNRLLNISRGMRSSCSGREWYYPLVTRELKRKGADGIFGQIECHCWTSEGKELFCKVKGVYKPPVVGDIRDLIFQCWLWCIAVYLDQETSS